MSHPSRLPHRFAAALAVLAAALPAAAQGKAPAGAMTTLAVLPMRGAFSVPAQAQPYPAQGQGPGARPYPGQGQGGNYRPYPAQVPGPNAQAAAGPRRLAAIEDQINQRVTMAFFGTGRFRLIEREQLNAVLKEGKFENSGLVDDATAAKLGRQLGAANVLVGSYTGGVGHTAEVKSSFFGSKTRTDTFNGHLEVRLRLVNTEDGSIREAFLVNAQSADPKPYHAYELLMDDLSRGMAAETAARFPLTRYVIKVLSEHEALVDLGRKQRLEKGASFHLVEQAPDVVHPVTGQRIQGERRVLTEMSVTDVGDESSTLRITGAKAALRVGQTVVQASAAAQPAAPAETQASAQGR
jgi:hypothetical protein